MSPSISACTTHRPEFEMLFKGFGEYLPDEYPYDVPGACRSVKRADFDKMVAVLPVADPNIFSAAQRITWRKHSSSWLRAPHRCTTCTRRTIVCIRLNVRDIDGILKVQTNQMPKDPASENIDAVDGKQLQAFAGQQHDSHIASHLIMGMSPLLQANPMAATELQKHILTTAQGRRGCRSRTVYAVRQRSRQHDL